MTTQYSDILINDNSIDLGWLKPYFVRSSAHNDNSGASAFPVAPDFPESNKICSALWRGYVATMRLHPDGRLELVQYDFPYAADSTPPQICNSFFVGSFEITFRPFFSGPNTTIPFRNGTIVQNREDWEIDDQIVSGVVSSVYRKRNTREAIGLNVDAWGRAFVPRSLVPLECRHDLDSLVGTSVDCSIHEIDEEHGNIILKIERVEDG